MRYLRSRFQSGRQIARFAHEEFLARQKGEKFILGGDMVGSLMPALIDFQPERTVESADIGQLLRLTEDVVDTVLGLVRWGPPPCRVTKQSLMGRRQVCNDRISGGVDERRNCE